MQNNKSMLHACMHVFRNLDLEVRVLNIRNNAQYIFMPKLSMLYFSRFL